jgi:hypothetical protein
MADASPEIDDAWTDLSTQLRGFGPNWQIWTDWYDAVVVGSPPAPPHSEAWDAAFTDVDEPLPWYDGAEAVNTEIARRLAKLEQSKRRRPEKKPTKQQTRAELAKVSSPQPSVTKDGRLDAGPNLVYDAPSVDDDLVTLPFRQRTLIKNILGDLPRNAPRHLVGCLQSYDDEIKARGVQPILGLLKDMADAIRAAVTAPRAEDEWLDPGMRQLFTSFDDNHDAIIRHFPLDPKREEIFADVPVNEADAVGPALSKPFEDVATASNKARRSGLTTDDFVAVVEKMTEFAKVVSTQPVNQPPSAVAPVNKRPPEIHIDLQDRPPVTTRKRTILNALGFFERAYNLAGSTASIEAVAHGADLIQALSDAIKALSAFIM